MPNNHQRREQAKRKLERQLEHRRELAKARRQRVTIASVVAAVVIVAIGIWVIQANSGDDTTAAGSPVEPPAVVETLPSGDTAAPEVPIGDCTYLPDGSTGGPALPTNIDPATSGVVAATLNLSAGAVGLNLDRAAAPCAVNSLISLAAQGYFDGTVCHRLTTSDTLKVLQCGDPTGSGSGGPGYSFADELSSVPTTGVTYPAGTIAMANAGADTNGSQFFLVYGASPLAASYTILGTMDEAGLSVVEDIGAAGVDGGGDDGPPATAITVESMTVPDDAVAASAADDTTEAAPTDAAPTDAASGTETAGTT